MPGKENFELPQADLTGAQIPDLKKRDKERKKTGAAWGGGRPLGSPLSGAASEEGAALGARAAAGAAEGVGAAGSAGAEAGFLASLAARASALLAEFTSTFLGKAAALAVAALLVGGIGALAYRMLAGSRSVRPTPDLGGISSTLKVARATEDTRLRYAAQSAGGQLDWANKPIASEDLKGPAAKDDAVQPPAQVQAGPAQPATVDSQRAQDGAAPQPHLAGGFGSQGGAGAATGGTGSLGSALGQYARNDGKLSANSGPAGGSAGKGGVLQAKNIRLGTGNMQLAHLAGNASRSLALLRGMASRYNSSMRAGGNTATEANAAAGQSQFEASELAGATAPTSPIDGAGSGNPSGGAGMGGGGSGGAASGNPTTVDQCNLDMGGYLDSNGQCTYQGTAGQNSTPWQGAVDKAKSLKMIVTMLLLGAGILAAIGGWKKLNPFEQPLAWALYGAALAMAGVAIGLSAQMISLGHQINAMGGSPLGDEFAKAGTMFIMVGCIDVGATFAAPFMHTTMVFHIVAVVGLLTSMMTLMMGLLSPPMPNVNIPQQTAINCPKGQQPVDPSSPGAGCQAISNQGGSNTPQCPAGTKATPTDDVFQPWVCK